MTSPNAHNTALICTVLHSDVVYNFGVVYCTAALYCTTLQFSVYLWCGVKLQCTAMYYTVLQFSTFEDDISLPLVTPSYTNRPINLTFIAWQPNELGSLQMQCSGLNHLQKLLYRSTFLK